MYRDELLLVIFLAISGGLLIYGLGASVTGYVMKTMYCEQEWCKDYCRFDSDCPISGDVCCEQDNFGICKQSSQCEIPHEFQPTIDISLGQMQTILEKPAPDYKQEILMFTTLLIALVIIVTFHNKHKKVLKK